MNKKKLAIGILLIVAMPLILFNVVDSLKGYVPLTKSYQKHPYEFEEAFNEQMAEYGMSIDIDSVHFTYGSGNPYKTVPVQCEDGSEIYCIYCPTSERQKSLIEWIVFEQKTEGAAAETIYLEPLLEFLLQEFDTPVTKDKDSTYEPLTAVTYNEAIQRCRDFVAGSERKTSFCVAPYPGDYSGFNLRHEQNDTVSYLIQLSLLTVSTGYSITN